ncbi:MAG: hypothetical protein ACPGQL_02180 [Thermoplasmatota archaeon]
MTSLFVLSASLAGAQDVPEEPARTALMAGPATLWTSLNMGPGSGLDADLLDGYEAADFFDALDAETAARSAADDALQMQIDDLDAGLRDDLMAEEAARIAADDALAADVAADLAAEQAARVAGDADLQAALDDERAARAGGDDALQLAVDDEAAARVAGDDALQDALDQEEAARMAADDALQAAIDDEADARAAADDLLSARLDDLEASATQTLSIPMGAFMAGDSDFSWHRNTFGLFGKEAGKFIWFYAPVQLPDGALITGLEATVRDSSTDHDMRVELVGTRLTDGAGLGFFNAYSTSDGGLQTVGSSLSHTVDHENNTLMVAVSWTVPSATTSLQIAGATVSYTLP